MNSQTGLMVRGVQVRTLLGVLGLSDDGVDGWLDRHGTWLPGNLRLTVDSRFDRMTLATRVREKDTFDALLAPWAGTPFMSLAAGLRARTSRVIPMLQLRRDGTAAGIGIGIGGAWDLETMGQAWSAADLPTDAWAMLTRMHALVGGGSFGGVATTDGALTLAFGVAVESGARADRADAVIAAAGECGTSHLQRGLLRGMLETWTPRDLNHLSIRMHLVDGKWRPGLDVAFLDVPNDHVVVGLQVGTKVPESGVLYGAIEGTLMPDRPVAIEVVFETGPNEPAIVHATLESSGIPE